MTESETRSIAKEEAKREVGCLAMFVLLLLCGAAFLFELIDQRLKALEKASGIQTSSEHQTKIKP